MSTFMDKTFSVREIWSWARRAIYLAIPLYVLAVFWNAWDLKMGGVSMSDSPFKDQVPEQCRGYAQKSFGTPAARTAMDSLLLRGRLQRYELNSVINNASPLFSCLGYAVLGGLPARVPSEADFTEQFVDASGNPVVTVRVEYQKTYAVSSGINK